MLTLTRAVLLLLLAAGRAFAFESQWVSGLHVVTEHLAGETGLNGMLFRIQRATGRDVHLLADRIFDDWRHESGTDRVLALNVAGWRSFSRIHHGDSEVVQWRGTGATSELIWSVTNLRQTSIVPPTGSVLLPPNCNWRPPVHGIVQEGVFIQNTGVCPREMAAVANQFRRLFDAKGWTLREHTPGVLQAQRGNQRAEVVFAPAHARSPATNVVILELAVESARTP